MAGPWEQYESPIALPDGAYRREDGLRGVVAFSPESQAQIAQQEANPANDIELDKEIRNAATPAIRYGLLQEKERRAGLTPPSNGEADEGPTDGPWAKYGKPWESYGPEADSALVHAGKRALGGLAAAEDIIGGIGGAAVGGIHGLGTLLTGGSLEDAVHNIENTSSKFMVGSQLKDPTVKESYETGMKPLEYLLEKAHQAGGAVSEATGSPILGTAANVALQLGVPVLGAKGLGAMSRATIKTTPTVAKRGMVTPETTDAALVDSLTMKAERAGTRPTTPETPSNLNSPDSIPYERVERPLEGTPETRPVHPDQAVETITPEQAATLPEMDFYADKGRDLGMQVDNLRTDKPTLDTSKPAPESLKAALEADSGRLFEPDNIEAVERANRGETDHTSRTGERFTIKRDEEGYKAYDADGNQIGELSTYGINPKTGKAFPALSEVQDAYRGKGVGGALYDRFLSEFGDAARPSGSTSAEAWHVWLKKKPNAVKEYIESELTKLKENENLSSKDKAKARAEFLKSFPPEVKTFIKNNKIGQTKAGRGQRGAVNFGRGEDFAKRLQVLKESSLFLKRGEEHYTPGTQVRLMNGKVGIISDVKNGRYQIKNLDGSMDSVPVQGIDYAYKPQTGGMSEGFLRAARKKQGGALNFGAFLKDKKPLSEIRFDEGTTTDLIRKALRQSDSPQEFVTALKGMVESPTINARAMELWESKEQILSKPKASEFSKLSKVDRQQTADVTRDAHQMMEEEGITKALTKKDDISRAARFGNVSAVQQLIHRGPAGAILKWVHSNINDIISQRESLYRAINAYAEPYKALRSKSRSRIMQAMLDFDGLSNRELIDAGLQWATPEMLAKKGLTDKEIMAYQALTEGLDRAYQLNAEMLRMDGKEPPPQIPGWFPHQWVGSYKVILRDANGNDFHMKAFPTRMQAQRYMNKAKYEFEARMEEPTAEIGSNDIAGTTIQALEVFKNRSKLDQVLLDKLNRLDRWSQQGMVRSMLERKANMGGFVGEDWQSSIFPDKVDSAIQSAYLKYIEDSTKAWANSKIAKVVKEPLNEHRELLKETPNLQHAIDEQIGRSVGKPVNHLKLIDENARAVAIWSGMPPDLIKTTMQAMNNFMVKAKLVVPNTAFWFVNSFQALTGLDALLRIHTERLNAGAPTGSVLKSTGVLMREWASFLNQGKWSPEYEAATKWLQEHGKFDNRLPDLLEADPTKIDTLKYPKKILERIEQHNKAASALSFYAYFREVMPPRQALEAAALHMDTVMGNYSPHQASGMFTDLGMVGQSMRPFHLLPMTIYGRMAMNLRLISDTVKTMKSEGRSPADIVKAVGPFAAMMGTFYMLAGMQGMPGWQEWDAVARTLNSWVNPDNAIPRPAEVARRYGADTPNIYGLLGSHIGPDGLNIGPSMNAPAVGDIGSMPWLNVAGAAAQGAGVAYDLARGEQPNMETAYKALRTALPPLLIPHVEKFIASKNDGMYPASNSLKGEYKRSEHEQFMAELTGKRSIKEQDQRDRNSLEKYYERVDHDWKSTQLDKLYQVVSGINPSRANAMEMARKMVAAGRGFEGDEIVDGLEERIMGGRTSAEQRNKLKIANSTNAAEMARRKEIMDGLRQYFKQNGH